MSLDQKLNYAFVDVETTGLNPDIHEIIEIGCIIVERGPGGPADLKVIEEIEMKVQPERMELAEPEALRINGYDPAQWMFAYTKSQALEVLTKKTDGCVFVAHNVAFDWMFIEKMYRDAGMEHKFHYHKLDTLSIAFAMFNGTTDVKHLSLRALCEHFGIKNERAHSALPDIRVTIEIFKKLMQMKK